MEIDMSKDEMLDQAAEIMQEADLIEMRAKMKAAEASVQGEYVTAIQLNALADKASRFATEMAAQISF